MNNPPDDSDNEGTPHPSHSGIYFPSPPRRSSRAVLGESGHWRSRDYGSFGHPAGKSEQRGMYLLETDLDTNESVYLVYGTPRSD